MNKKKRLILVLLSCIMLSGCAAWTPIMGLTAAVTQHVWGTGNQKIQGQ